MANIEELRGERLRKLKDIKELGFDPYPQKANRTHLANEVVENYSDLEDEQVSVTGRISSIRLMGGLAFIDVTDKSGKVQLVAKKQTLKRKVDENGVGFSDLNLLDSGDFIEATGTVGKTNTEEESVFLSELRLLSKSLRPLPDPHEGLKDTETRMRQRYIDLILNEDVKETFDTRIKITNILREFLENQDFVEIETPILQPIYGGASARPFTTYHHKLETDLFLRISDELYLKRAIVGGYEKVFEFGRDFRNEGIDRSHNPEFTQLEFYWAYADYNDLMDLTEEMLKKLVQEIKGGLKFEYQGEEIDLSKPIRRATFAELIKEHTGVDITGIDRETLIEEIKERKLDIDLDGNPPLKDLLDDFYKHSVRPNIVQPVFLLDYPAEMMPLAKTKDDDDSLVASMQLVIAGEEYVKAYNELNDPLKQLENWQKEQAVLDEGESEEAQPIDYDYVRALEYGMPPTAGWGMGIDRLTMLLCNKDTIKETIMFPTLRPEEFNPEEFHF